MTGGGIGVKCEMTIVRSKGDHNLFGALQL
jgi:hypothetical protein